MGKYTEIAKAELDKLLINNNAITQEVENAKAALGGSDALDFTKENTDALQQIRAFYELSRGEEDRSKVEKIINNIKNVFIKEILHMFSPDNDDAVDADNMSEQDVARLHQLLNTACSSIYGVATFNSVANKDQCINAIRDMLIAKYPSLYASLFPDDVSKREGDENFGDISYVDYSAQFTFKFADEDRCIATRYIRGIAEIAREEGVYKAAVEAISKIFIGDEKTPEYWINLYNEEAKGKDREEKEKLVIEKLLPQLENYAEEGESKDTKDKEINKAREKEKNKANGGDNKAPEKEDNAEDEEDHLDKEKRDSAYYKSGVMLNFFYKLIYENEIDAKWLLPQFALVAFNNIDVIDNALFFLLQLFKIDHVNQLVVANDIFIIGTAATDEQVKDHAIQVMASCLDEARASALMLKGAGDKPLPGNEERVRDIDHLISYITSHKIQMERSKLSQSDRDKKNKEDWELKIQSLKTPHERLVDEWNKKKDEGKLDRAAIQEMMNHIPALKNRDKDIPSTFLELLGRTDDYKLDADMMKSFIGPYLIRCLTDGFIAPAYEGGEYDIVNLFIKLQKDLAVSVPLTTLSVCIHNIYSVPSPAKIAATYNLIGQYFSEEDFPKLSSQDTIMAYYRCVLSYLQHAGQNANIKCVFEVLDKAIGLLSDSDCDYNTVENHIIALSFLVNEFTESGKTALKSHEKTPDNVCNLNISLLKLFDMDKDKLTERAVKLLCGSLGKLNKKYMSDDKDGLQALRSVIALKLNDLDKDSGGSGSDDEDDGSASWMSESLIQIVNDCLPDDLKLIPGIDNSENRPPMVRSTILELSGAYNFFMSNAIDNLRKNKKMKRYSGVIHNREKKVMIAFCKLGNNVHRIEHCYSDENTGTGNIEQIIKHDNNENRPELAYVVVSANFFEDNDISSVISNACTKLCQDIHPSQVIAVVISEKELDGDTFEANQSSLKSIFLEYMDEENITVMPLNGTGSEDPKTQDTMKAIMDKADELFPAR